MKIERPLLLCGFLILVVGGGFLMGFLTLPGRWYSDLVKPSFTPPNWVFPAAWSVLYVLIAISGYRTWRLGGGRSKQLWGLQLALNFLWPTIFFGAQQIAIAFMVIILLLTALICFLAVPGDGWAKLLFLPYAAWVAFAAVLNGAILAAN